MKFRSKLFRVVFLRRGFAQKQAVREGSRKRRSTYSGNANASSGGGGPIIKEVNDGGEEYSDEDSDDDSDDDEDYDDDCSDDDSDDDECGSHSDDYDSDRGGSVVFGQRGPMPRSGFEKVFR